MIHCCPGSATRFVPFNLQLPQLNRPLHSNYPFLIAPLYHNCFNEFSIVYSVSTLNPIMNFAKWISTKASNLFTGNPTSSNSANSNIYSDQTELNPLQSSLDDNPESIHTLLDQFMLLHETTENVTSTASTTAADPAQSRRHTKFECPVIDESEDNATRIHQKIEEFLSRLCILYHLYGCPTHVIEVTMPRVAKGLGIIADFAIFPTYSLVTFYRRKENDSDRQTLYFRTNSGVNLYKLQLIDELARRVASYADPQSTRMKSTTLSIFAPVNFSLIPPTSHLPSSPVFRDSIHRESTVSKNDSDSLRQIILEQASSGDGFFHNVCFICYLMVRRGNYWDRTHPYR